MEHLLMAAAEQQELDRAIKAYQNIAPQLEEKIQVDFMLTGIGAVNTCYRLTRKILEAKAEGRPYTLLADLGIAGSYDLTRFPEGSATIVKEEFFGDLGFETPGGFKTLFECYCVEDDLPPFQKGILPRLPLPQQHLEALLQTWLPATGVTIQTITHDPVKVKNLEDKFHGEVESMEGAAFYYVALLEKIPFFELRTVSNVVGESDSSRWETQKALDCLEKSCEEILLALVQDV